MTIMAYKRVLLKLSGEALMGDDNYGINRAVIERVVSEIAEVIRLNVEVRRKYFPRYDIIIG